MTMQPGFNSPVPPVAPIAMTEALDEVDDRDDNELIDAERVVPIEPDEAEPTIIRHPDLDQQLRDEAN